MKTPRQLNRSWPRIAGLALAYLCVILGVATCGSAATTAPQTRPFSSAQATTQFAIADFDGDHRPDLATVQVGHGNFQDTQYWIAFHLSSGARQTLGITAPTGGLRITSRDVNGDDFPDIVVTTAWADRPVAVLLNDGRGNFRVLDPSAFSAAFTTSGESCASVTEEIPDGTAILLSRYRAGACPEGRDFSSCLNVTGPVVPRATRNSISVVVVSFLGRAPPSFLSHT
jgi:hypothetical protein